MENKIFEIFKGLIDKLICYKAQTSLSEDFKIQQLLTETFSDINCESLPPTSEDILIQQVPSIKKKIPLHDKDFKITNLDTGEEVDIRNENHSEFLQQISEITNTGEYSEAISIYFTQKQKMNKALWEAVENNQLEICRLLLSRKNYGDLVAQTNSRAPNEETALHMAARNGNLKICEVLLGLGEGTDVNAKDLQGCTPLHLACKNGHYLVAQLLIRFGSLINDTDKYLNTPMHYAAASGDLSLINYLFKRFSNLNTENAQRLSPRDILNQKGIDLGDNSDVQIVEIDNSMFSRDSQVIEFEAEPKISYNDFEAVQLLGRGSFGEVFLVKMKSTGKKFAMKVLNKDKIVGQNLVKYAMVERNVLSYMKHPFIVGLNYAFQSSEKLYLVLDYCSGGSLSLYIHKYKRFSESISRFYLCEIILALEELHKHDIIYRDLKPDNVVIDSDGHAMLTDFGLSKEGVQDNISARSFCGSIAYLAPDMLKRKGHGKAVDWYLLGIIFYEMLVGIPPFYSSNKEQLFYNIQNNKLEVPAGISPEAASLLKKLLKKNPEKRIGTVNGASEIKEHPFFAEISWESTLKRELTPPITPFMNHITGFIPKNYMQDDDFLQNDTRHLDGWTFIAPNTFIN